MQIHYVFTFCVILAVTCLVIYTFSGTLRPPSFRFITCNFTYRFKYTYRFNCTLWCDDGERKEKSSADQLPYNVSHQLGLAIFWLRKATSLVTIIWLFILSFTCGCKLIPFDISSYSLDILEYDLLQDLIYLASVNSGLFVLPELALSAKHLTPVIM